MSILRTLSLLVLALLLFACQSKEVLPPPNIVWITSEDNSKHYMSLFDENGISVPNIEKLAKKGVTFKRAFSNGPVCSVARSTLISGCYAPRIGAQYHRKIEQVPMPDSLLMFPAYLRKAGYYTTNNAKEDYNIVKSEGVWDESSRKASWRNRAMGQPFFHVQNFHVSHESSLFFTDEEMEEGMAAGTQDSFYIHPYHPQTETFTYTNIRYRNKLRTMDEQVGKVIEKLAKDSLLENTFIFYFGDHGGVLPGSKGYVKEVGLHVPLVLYVPKKYENWSPFKQGSETNSFVSFVDFGPTVLKLAGLDVPEGMNGKAFVGKGIKEKEVTKRNETFSYADRFDGKYDLVRAYRKGKYKYIRNFQPYHHDALWNDYRFRQTGYREWLQLHKEGKLNEIQASFFEAKDAEELYDLEADPFETRNLANSLDHQEALAEMRAGINEWITSSNDLSFIPEYRLLKEGAMKNPKKYGEEHSEAIASYVATSDLMLEDFDSVQKELETALQAKDPLERFWALTTCMSFGEEAKPIAARIRAIKSKDEDLMNRALAATYLTFTETENSIQDLEKELYQIEDPIEALWLLNEFAWLQDLHGFHFEINERNLIEAVKEYPSVRRRLDHLKG